jgi:tRNA threonylcarbamoyladenosine biosynthesis protein TsaE
MPSSYTILLADLSATERLAQQVAQHTSAPQTIALSGTLGAGKTQWIRFFCEALGVSAQVVTSPTYVLQQRYRGATLELHHFDYYRLEKSAQVWDLGMDELQESPVVILVEWADKFPETLPEDRLEIDLSSLDSEARQARLTATGPRSADLLVKIHVT